MLAARFGGRSTTHQTSAESAHKYIENAVAKVKAKKFTPTCGCEQAYSASRLIAPLLGSQLRIIALIANKARLSL